MLNLSNSIDMKIAIIGAGFAGLSSAWHLLKYGSAEITLFDHLGIGGGASGIAAGLLHPFTGLHAKLNRFGKEGYQSSLALLEIASQALNKEVSKPSQILRLALTSSQKQDYFKSSLLNDEIKWLEAKECQALEPSLNPYPGILINKATIVYTENYLKGLFLACQRLGMKFEVDKITSFAKLNNFDHIVVTAGADTKVFAELQSLDLFLVKGQILKLEWPKDLPPLALPINSEKYILMDQDMKSSIVGATFERNFASSSQDLSFAKSEIMPKIFQFLPSLKNAKITECKAAVRVTTKDHLPLVQKMSPRISLFIGLGSKGLLYHAYYGSKLVNIIYS